MPLSVKEFNKKILDFPISDMVLGYLLICLSTIRELRYISNILRLPDATCETKYSRCSLQIYKRWFLSFVKYKERTVFKALNVRKLRNEETVQKLGYVWRFSNKN